MFNTPGHRRVPNPFRDEEESLPLCAPNSSTQSNFSLKKLFVGFVLIIGIITLIKSEKGVESAVPGHYPTEEGECYHSSCDSWLEPPSTHPSVLFLTRLPHLISF